MSRHQWLVHQTRKILNKEPISCHNTRKNYSLGVQIIKNSNLNLNHCYEVNYCLSLRHAQTKPVKCWKCGVEKKSVSELFCEKCKIIQNPHETRNYFKVLGIEENFDLDAKTLTQTYRTMQSLLHPDKFSIKSEQEKLISEDYSSLLNKAYDTLQIPMSRAIHMLLNRGEKVDEDQKVSDPDFLMEIMELNEEVEGASTPEKLKALNVKNKSILDKIAREISTHFQANDLQKAKECVVKMKYYNSIGTRINGLMRGKGIVD